MSGKSSESWKYSLSFKGSQVIHRYNFSGRKVKTQATAFAGVISKDIMAEVNEMTADLTATGKKNAANIVQTIIRDGAEVIKQAAIVVVNKVSSFFKKLFKW